MMSTHTARITSAKSQRVKTYKVAPVTRAIRAALAVSATALALAGSGLAFAGDCSTPLSTSIHCQGAFVDLQPAVDLTTVRQGDLPDSVTDDSHNGRWGAALADTAGIFVDDSQGLTGASFGMQSFGAVYDLTLAALVPGPGTGGLPPAAGDDFGYFLDSPGTTEVVDILAGDSYTASSATGLAEAVFAAAADITVNNAGSLDATGYTWAAGIEAEGEDIATVTNTGSISATATGTYGEAWGIYASGGDAATVTNSGSISAVVTGIYGDFYGRATGIYGSSYGDVTIDNSVGGSIDVNAYGYAYGISAAAGGSVDIGNDGDITVSSADRSAYGIYASEGNVNISNGGSIQVSAQDNANGIYADTSGDIDISNAGSIIANADAFSATGISAYTDAGTISISNAGDIAATSFVGNAYGIYAYSDYGNITIDNVGSIVAVGGFGDAQGVYVNTYSGDISVSNGGSITASSGDDAYGIYAYADDLGDISIDNTGSISAASGYGDAHGIYAYTNDGDISITSDGSITASSISGDAHGINADTDDGDISISNNGNIIVNSDSYTYGINADAYGDVSISNGGSISVSSGDKYAYGIEVETNGNISISNDGSIQASAYDDAYGIYADAYYGDISISNGGSISVSSIDSDAYGVYAFTQGDISISNAGSIDVSAYDGAYGIYADGSGDVSISNVGSISASSDGYAYGIQVEADGDISISSDGSIEVSAYEDAYGIYAEGEADGGGDIAISNTGSINVNSVDEDAYGIYADTYETSGDISISNGGSIDVSAYDDAAGIYADAGGNASISHAGSIEVSAYDEASGISAFSKYGNVGIDSTGDIAVSTVYGEGSGITANADGDVNIGSGGDITVVSEYGDAAGLSAYGSNVEIDNGGDIDVTGYANAAGISGYAEGDVTIGNSGSIVVATTDEYGQQQAIGPYYSGAMAAGIYAFADDGNLVIDNSGSITVNAASGDAVGIYGYGLYDAVIHNSGDISATAGGAEAAGIYVRGIYGVTVDNSATITAVVTAEGLDSPSLKYSHGVLASSYYGPVVVSNSGDITASADGLINRAVGIGAFSQGGDVTVTGTAGSIGVDAKYAIGIFADSEAGDVTVGSAGAIDVHSTGRAFGIQASSEQGGVIVDNAGDIHVGTVVDTDTPDIPYGPDLSGYLGHAIGIAATSDAGAVDIDNSGSIEVAAARGYAGGMLLSGITVTAANAGDITVSGYAEAIGVGAMAYGGDVTVGNSGTITATATAATAGSPPEEALVAITGYGAASGIQADIASGDIVIDNTGSISASAIHGDAAGIYGYTGDGDISIGAGSAASISASSEIAEAVGIHAYGHNVTIDSADIAVAGATAATGIFAVAGTGDLIVTGAGDISASLQAGNAMGIYGYAYGDASVGNSGSIAATSDNGAGVGMYAFGQNVTIDSADITATGTSGAIGVLAIASAGDLVVDGNGRIVVATDAGDATGIEGSASGNVDITNAGGIAITAGGDEAFATGIHAMGTTGNSIANSGAISAESTGDAGEAFGLLAQSAADIVVDNTGVIQATDADRAVAVGLDSATGSRLTNAGMIAAHSTADGSIAIEGGEMTDSIVNTGVIQGAIVTAGSDDTLSNDGVWSVLGHSTDFGAGNDTVHNGTAGIIALTDASISLGEGSGNAFINDGTVVVSGDGLIDMDGVVAAASAPVFAALAMASTADAPALTPLAFANNGLIDFVDGAPDDILTIDGDFGGEGALNVDVSLFNQASDMLYVEGDVVDGTVQKINVNILDLPSDTDPDPIAIVNVTGASQEGDFIPGSFVMNGVDFSANNFLDLDFKIVAQIDSSEALADEFLLDVDFRGLNDTGSLAASIASGAQSLMGTQVGTWRQRMGVFSQLSDSDRNGWVRVFHDSGNLDPAHTADNFPQGGNFGFDQSNSGAEVGINAVVVNGVNIGATLGKSRGKQHLDRPGIGSDKIEAGSAGLYLTWISPTGSYIDASYRWMHFDAHLESAAGQQTAGGDAGAFNVEGGYAWTMDNGMSLVPQMQYTRTRIHDIDTLYGDLAQFQAEGGTSSRGRVGLSLQKTFSNAGGAFWTPYASASAVREFDGLYTYAINDNFTGSTSIEGTSALVELGANVQTGKLSMFGGVNWTDGGAIDSFIGGQLGLRYTW